MVNQRTVYAGICKRDGKLVCGIVEPQEFCDENSWVPPHVVADMGHPNRICAYYPDTMVIGRCGEGGPCSNMAERCDDPSSFLPMDPDCRITKDYGPSGKYTTYGKCGDRCVWSPSDCSEEEVYVRDDPSCTADKVKLGACLDGFGYCTVSQDTCANLDGKTIEPYYNHSSFLEKFDTNCYLADLPKTPAPVAPSRAPTMIPTALPTSSPTLGTSSPMVQKARLSDGDILGIAIGSALVVGISFGFVASRICSNKQARAKGVQDESSPPPKTIRIGTGDEINIDPSEDLSLA